MAPKEKQQIEIEKTHRDPLPSFNQAVTVDCSDFLGTALTLHNRPIQPRTTRTKARDEFSNGVGTGKGKPQFRTRCGEEEVHLASAISGMCAGTPSLMRRYLCRAVEATSLAFILGCSTSRNRL